MALMGVLGTNDGVIFYDPLSGKITQLLELEHNLSRFSKVVLGEKGSVELFYLKYETSFNINPLFQRQL